MYICIHAVHTSVYTAIYLTTCHIFLQFRAATNWPFAMFYKTRPFFHRRYLEKSFFIKMTCQSIPLPCSVYTKKVRRGPPRGLCLENFLQNGCKPDSAECCMWFVLAVRPVLLLYCNSDTAQHILHVSPPCILLHGPDPSL